MEMFLLILIVAILLIGARAVLAILKGGALVFAIVAMGAILLGLLFVVAHWIVDDPYSLGPIAALVVLALGGWIYGEVKLRRQQEQERKASETAIEEARQQEIIELAKKHKQRESVNADNDTGVY